MYKLLFIFILTSCVVQEKSVSKKDKTNQNTDPEIYSTLVGVWKTNCIDGSTDSYQLTFSFNQDGSSSLKEEFFYGTGCAIPDTVWTSHYDYIDNNGSTDFERTKVTMIPQHSDTVDYFNTSGDEWCGINDWVIDESRDVTGLDCEAFPTDSNPISTTYTIDENALEFFNYWLFENELYYKI